LDPRRRPKPTTPASTASASGPGDAGELARQPQPRVPFCAGAGRVGGSSPGTGSVSGCADFRDCATGASTPPASASSGTSCGTIAAASCTPPRGANAGSGAGLVPGRPPPGGPPQIPRRGLAQAIGPVHG